MKYPFLVFAAVVAALGASWVGMVAFPERQLGALGAYRATNDAGIVSAYPSARPGEAAQGAAVYASLRCAACHTQQVRPESEGSDLARGWGRRRTVARDYAFDDPAQLGQGRLGPDLANYGARLGTNSFPMIRLFNPRLVVTNSLCPGAPSLFIRRVVRTAGPALRALKLAGTSGLAPGQEVVPTLEAEQLSAYLISLSSTTDLPEAPLPVADATGKP